MANKKPYAYWYGDPLTEFEYNIYLQDILLDNIIEEYVQSYRLDEAYYYINLIKRGINDKNL